MDLSSNTGYSGGGIYDVLGGLGALANTGAQVYGTITGTHPPQTTGPAPAAPAPTTPAWQKYLPWAIGGVVLLLVVGLVFRRK